MVHGSSSMMVSWVKGYSGALYSQQSELRSLQCNHWLKGNVRNHSITGLISRVVSAASDCGVRGPRFESHRGRLCLSWQLLRYTALGTGCAPLLQCLGRLSLPPFVERWNEHQPTSWVIITMAMVDVGDSCQFSADSQPKSIGLI